MGCGSSNKTHPEEEVAAQDIQNRNNNNKNNNGIRNFGPNFDNGSNDNSYNSTSSSSTAAHNRNVSVSMSLGSTNSFGSPSRRATIRQNQWKKGELIGAGAYGRVFMGMNELTGGLIAIKEMVFTQDNEKEMKSLQREVSLMRKFAHPNIVAYLGTEVGDANTLYIFTEWVPGGSLQSLLKKFGRFKESVVQNYTLQMLKGLKYLHENGVVHRDIKGSNILVDDRGNVKLCDFGASKQVTGGNNNLGGQTIQGDNLSLKGTPYFMAPEVITQTGHGRKADVWSLGCTVLQMSTGQPPWKALNFGNISALMYHIANTAEAPPMPDDMSPELRSFLNSCFLRNPLTRPSINELLQHPFVQGVGDPKSWEQTINGGTTAELLEEMLANTPSPLKIRRSGNRLSHTNSSNSSNNNNNLDDSNGGGVLTNSGAVLSDMSLSHDFQDEEEEDVDWGQFTLGEQVSHDVIKEHLIKQASLERSMGSELGTPLNSPRNNNKPSSGNKNPYARGQDKIPNNNTTTSDDSEYASTEGKDIITPLVKLDNINDNSMNSEDDPLKNSWVESQNRVINTSSAIQDRNEMLKHEQQEKEQKIAQQRRWEEELEAERIYQEEQRLKKLREAQN